MKLEKTWTSITMKDKQYLFVNISYSGTATLTVAIHLAPCRQAHLYIGVVMNVPFRYCLLICVLQVVCICLNHCMNQSHNIVLQLTVSCVGLQIFKYQGHWLLCAKNCHSLSLKGDVNMCHRIYFFIVIYQVLEPANA